MYEPLIQDFKPAADASTKRVQDLFTTIGNSNNGTIDWATGRTTVRNSDAILNGIRSMTGTVGPDDPAANFLALLQDGFAVPNGAPPPNDPNFRYIPWRSLFDSASVQSMTRDDWAWLGVADVAGLANLQTTMSGRFSYRPSYVLEPAHLQSIMNTAQLYLSALLEPAAPPPTLPVARIDAPTASDTGVIPGRPIPLPAPPTLFPTGGTMPSPSPPKTLDLNSLADIVVTFCRDMAQCFAHAGYSVRMFGFIPIGVQICLDAGCAQKFIDDLNAVITKASGSLVAIISSITASGITALLSIGPSGWVGLAILHFAIYWLPMVKLNMTPRGVCIVHFFPWISALSGGLVNGYAQGI